MKATINGVSVEGTPQEIAEYVRLVRPQTIATKTPGVYTVPLPYKPADIYCGGVAPGATL